MAIAILPASSMATRFPGQEWERVGGEEAVEWEKKLAEAKALFEKNGGTAAMIVKDGVVIADWGQTSGVFNIHSVRKSLLSALIGIAVEKGQIDLSWTMADLGIDDNEPTLSDEEKKATVHDLLKARSGIYHPALYESESMKKRRPARHSHAPGTFWYYNNWDFNALGTIYEMLTKTSIFDAFEKEIAQPLQMEDYFPSCGSYVTGSDSIHRAYPFRMSARDLARFGLLYMNEGRWKDRQIIPAQWVRDSVKPYSTTHENRGYGYMWWVNKNADGVTIDGVPDAYHAAGVGGQMVWVSPSLKLVIVHRVDVNNPQAQRVSGNQLREWVDVIVKSIQ